MIPPPTNNRFVSGHYCSVLINMTGVGDFVVLLSTPTDGKYPNNVYRWIPLEIILTKHEILAFVAQDCLQQNHAVYRIPHRFRGNVEILAPIYRQELCDFLLSAIALDAMLMDKELGVLASTTRPLYNPSSGSLPPRTPTKPIIHASTKIPSSNTKGIILTITSVSYRYPFRYPTPSISSLFHNFLSSSLSMI